jgi:hypothetical protein
MLSKFDGSFPHKIAVAANYHFSTRPLICLAPLREGTLPVNALGNTFDDLSMERYSHEIRMVSLRAPDVKRDPYQNMNCHPDRSVPGFPTTLH